MENENLIYKLKLIGLKDVLESIKENFSYYENIEAEDLKKDKWGVISFFIDNEQYIYETLKILKIEKYIKVRIVTGQRTRTNIFFFGNRHEIMALNKESKKRLSQLNQKLSSL